MGIAANASAGVMVKMAVLSPRKFPSLSDTMAALANWPLWLGLGFYGAAFLFYAGALAHFPLSVVHPVQTSGGIVLVAMAAMLYFHEQFYWTTILGIALVIIGVALITARAG